MKTIRHGYVLKKSIILILIFAIHLVFEPTLSAQTEQIDVALALANGQATVTNTTIDIGAIDNIFDGNTETLARTESINPMVVTLSFANPKQLARSRIWFPAGDNRWRIETADTIADLDAARGSFRVALDWATGGEVAWQDRNLSAPITCRAIRLKLERLTGDNYVHLNEWQLYLSNQPPPPSRAALAALRMEGFEEIPVNTAWGYAPPSGWASPGESDEIIIPNLVPGKQHYIDITYRGPDTPLPLMYFSISGSSPAWELKLLEWSNGSYFTSGPLSGIKNNETQRIAFIPSSTSMRLYGSVNGGNILVNSIYRPTGIVTPTPAIATSFELTWAGMRNANTFCIQFDMALSDETKTRPVRVETMINGTPVNRVFEKGDNRIYHTGQIDIDLAEPEFKRFDDKVVVDLKVTVDQFVRTRRVVIPLPVIFVGGIDPPLPPLMQTSAYVQGGNGTFQMFEDFLDNQLAGLNNPADKYLCETDTSLDRVAKSYCYLVNVAGKQPGFPTRAGSGSWDVPYYPTMHTLSFFGEKVDRNTVGLFEGGNYLRTAMDVMLSRTYAKRVNIIAHSKGCLITRALLAQKYEELDGSGRMTAKSYGLKVRNAIMIQGPHYGSILGEAPLLFRSAFPLFTNYSSAVYKNLYPLWPCFKEQKAQSKFTPDPDFDNSELKALNRQDLPSRSGVKYVLVYSSVPSIPDIPNNPFIPNGTPYTQTGRFRTDVFNTPMGPQVVPKFPRFSSGEGDLVVPLFSQKGYRYNANEPHAYSMSAPNVLNGLISAFVKAAKAKCIVWSRITANHMNSTSSPQMFRTAWNLLSAPITSRLEYPGEEGEGFLPEEDDAAEPVPNAPGDPVVHSVTQTNARVQWKDLSLNEANFVVEIRNPGGSWMAKATVLPNITAATLESLTPGRNHEVRILAVNNAGGTSASNIASFTTTLTLVAPKELNGNALSPNTVEVFWSFNDPYADRFQLMYRIPGQSDWAYLPDPVLNSKEVEIQGLPANSTIELRMRAVYKRASGGESASEWSKTITVKTPAFAAVESASASVQSAWAILVQWSFNGTGHQRFQLMRRDVSGGGGWTYLSDPAATERSVLDTGLLPYREYEYQVRAIHPQEQISEWRETGVVRTQQIPVAPPSTPGNLRAATAYAHDVVLNWDYSSTDGQFIIEQLSPGGSWFRARLLDGRNRSINIGGLQNDSYYEFAIRFITSDGRLSEHSNLIGVQTAGAGQIETPASLRSNSPGPSNVHLEWDYRSDVTFFIVEQWSIITGWIRAATISGDSKAYDVNGLRPSTDYQFAIRAISPYGELSEHSNVILLGTSAGIPGSPNDLHRGEVGTDWFDIVWNDNANNENLQEVWVKPEGGSFQLAENVAANTSRARVEYERSGGSRLRPNILYTVRVYAVNGFGKSAYDEVQIRTRN